MTKLIKLCADAIFTGEKLLRDKLALIADEWGNIINITSLAEAGDDVQYHQGILTPGFINAHCHLELSHLKNGFSEKTGLIDFALNVILRRNDFDINQIITAAEIAEREMLENGIVAIGDISNTDHTINIKKKQHLHYHTFIETMGFVPEQAEARLDYSKELAKKFQNITPYSLVPHAPYSVSKDLFQKISALENNFPLSIHNQETGAEDEWYQNKNGGLINLYQRLNIPVNEFQPSGKSSIQTYLPYFSKEKIFLFVHNTFTSKEDIQFAQDYLQKCYWCFCPNANLYIENRLPDIDLFINNNCRITLGTDSLASNHQLSILAEMKTINKNFPHIPLQELLKWATINGAEALQVEEQLGSFDKGKKPGILLLSGLKENDLSKGVIKKLF